MLFLWGLQYVVVPPTGRGWMNTQPGTFPYTDITSLFCYVHHQTMRLLRAGKGTAAKGKACITTCCIIFSSHTRTWLLVRWNNQRVRGDVPMLSERENELYWSGMFTHTGNVLFVLRFKRNLWTKCFVWCTTGQRERANRPILRHLSHCSSFSLLLFSLFSPYSSSILPFSGTEYMGESHEIC